MVKDLPHSSPSLSGPKRFRPPHVDPPHMAEKKILPTNNPVLRLDGDIEDTLQLSDSDTSDSEVKAASQSTSRLNLPSADDLLPEDISKDLAVLHQLRQNVKKNLKLRPIRSRSNLPKVNLDIDGDLESVISNPLFSGDAKDQPGSVQAYGTDPPQSALSPTSAVSSYFTPVETTPFSALFSSNGTTSTPLSSALPPLPISPRTLYERLSAPLRPLLIDTRVLATYQSFHLRYSINIAIPSLILKRCRKPGGGLQSIDSLRQFITTEQATMRWNLLMAPGGSWDGNVVVYDDEMNPKDKDSTAWVIIPVLQPLLNYGTISYLEGGLSKAGHDPDLRKLIINGDEKDHETLDGFSSFQTKIDPPPQSRLTITGPTLNGRKPSLGLFQLDTHAALRSKQLPEIEPSTTSTDPSSLLPPPSPLPVMPLATSYHSPRSAGLTESSTLNLSVSAATPSPPPSSVGFRKPQPTRRPSVPNLRRLDTKSAERLRDVPKLSVRTKPMRSATLAVPPTLSLNIFAPPHSPTRLNLKHSNHAPSPTRLCGNNPLSPTSDPANYLTPYYTPPHTPRVHRADDLPEPPRTPLTARPDLEPPTTDDSFLFTISTILPNFLYLGPELTTPEHVEELRGLGVRRILNIAAECDDDNGLKLREVFEKYYKIPMRDTVEEDNIARGVREVCDILGEFRLRCRLCFSLQSITLILSFQMMPGFILHPPTSIAKPESRAL